MDNFHRFSKYDQLRNVAAELYRAKEWPDDAVKRQGALERAIGLADRMLTDPKWSDNLRLPLLLREGLARAYAEAGSGAEILAMI